MWNNAVYLPENPIVYIILPKSIRNRASFAIFAQDAGIGCVLLRIVLVINITKYNLYEYRVRKVQYFEGGERG